MPNRTPFMFSFCRICLVRGSSARLNSRGDSGHHCLVPLNRVIGSDILPGVSIRDVGEAYISLRKAVNSPVKPICSITLKEPV